MTNSNSIRICSLLFITCFISAICCAGQAVDGDQVTWPDLSGDWVMVQSLVAAADLPLVGTLFIDTTVGVLNHITQSGSLLTVQDTYCFTDAAPSTPLFLTNIADEVMQSICPAPRSVQLEQTEEGILMSQDWHVEVRGAVLENPDTDALPTSADDPRLVDLEGDGFPGMTIQVEIVGILTGDTYAVQRYRYRLQGEVVDDNTIVGLIDWTSEQTVVAGTNDLFLLPFQDYTDRNSAKHRFIMTRADEAWTCATLREQLPCLLEQMDVLLPLPTDG